MYILPSLSNKTSTVASQGNRGRLWAGEKFFERVREYNELEVLVAGAVLFLKRRRACSPTALAPATAAAAS
jgi:hypothetical protein